MDNVNFSEPPALPTVQLRAAPLPGLLKYISVHLYWVVSKGQDSWHRWEVWQWRNAFRQPQTPMQVAYGHVHRNLMAPLQGIGGGPSYALQTWQGETAEKILAALERHSETYISRDVYWLWPGPNSNTYVARILAYAGVRVSLPGTAIGKDWDGIFKIQLARSPFLLQLYTPILGAKVSLTRDLELNFLGSTLGFDLQRQELKHPFGKGIWKRRLLS